MPNKRLLERRYVYRIQIVELEVDDWILLPRPVRLVDGKPLEQLAPAAKERLERGDRERLAESARTRQEEQLGVVVRDKTMDEHRLVDVDFSIPPYGREVVRVCGYRSHCRTLYQNGRARRNRVVRQ